MTIAAPVRFSPSLEYVKPHEHETIAGLNDTFNTIPELSTRTGA